MKYKILMYDGHPVKRVLYDRIVLIDQRHETPILLDHGTTHESLIKSSFWNPPWKEDFAIQLKKCDLEEVDLKFTKSI